MKETWLLLVKKLHQGLKSVSVLFEKITEDALKSLGSAFMCQDDVLVFRTFQT